MNIINIFTYKEYANYRDLLDNYNDYFYNENIIQEEETNYIIEPENNKIFKKMLKNKKEILAFINRALKLKYQIKEKEIEKYTNGYIKEWLKNEEIGSIYYYKKQQIFFLLQHETKIDCAVLLKILQYEFALMESVVDKKKIGQNGYKTPIIIPIILYTGKKKFNIKKCLKEMPEEFEEYKEQDLLKYNIVDINNYTKEELLKDKST